MWLNRLGANFFSYRKGDVCPEEYTSKFLVRNVLLFVGPSVCVSVLSQVSNAIEEMNKLDSYLSYDT